MEPIPRWENRPAASARHQYCNIIEAPWLVNGGHGASLRQGAPHRPRRARGYRERDVGRDLVLVVGGGTPVLLPCGGRGAIDSQSKNGHRHTADPARHTAPWHSACSAQPASRPTRPPARTEGAEDSGTTAWLAGRFVRRPGRRHTGDGHASPGRIAPARRRRGRWAAPRT
jgi:hypothetical protein